MARLYNKKCLWGGHYDPESGVKYQWMFPINPQECSPNYIDDNDFVQFNIPNNYMDGYHKPSDPKHTREVRLYDLVEVRVNKQDNNPAKVIAQGIIIELQDNKPFDENARRYMVGDYDDTCPHRVLVKITSKVTKNCTPTNGTYYQGKSRKHQGYTHPKDENS